MLVCSVALRPKRGAIAATITEVVTATDALSIGAIFAILADVPGTASDYLDAFNGKRMVETASAVDTVNAGSLRNAAIVEETNAGATFIAADPGPAVLVTRHSMVGTVMVNSDGTARQANANGNMVNL